MLVYLLLKRAKAYDAEYILGYLKLPETEEDLGGLYELGLEALAQEPWDDEGENS